MSDKTPKFMVVEHSEVPDRVSGNHGRPFSPLTVALLAGNTIWVAKEGDWAFRKTLNAHGKRLRTRRAERDGVKGMYLWTEEL